MGTTRDANGKGFRGPEPGGSGDRSSSRTRGEKSEGGEDRPNDVGSVAGLKL